MNQTIKIDGREYELVPKGYELPQYNEKGEYVGAMFVLEGYLLKPLHGEIDLSDKDTNE